MIFTYPQRVSSYLYPVWIVLRKMAIIKTVGIIVALFAIAVVLEGKNVEYRTSILSMSKKNATLPKLNINEDDLKQHIGLLIIRKILSQGDILTEKKKLQIDSLVEKSKLTCSLCADGVKLVQILLGNNFGHGIISDIAIPVCKLLKVEDSRVCHLAVDEFRDMMFYMLFNLKPNEMCYWLLKDKCEKPEGFLPDWSITMPDKQPPTYRQPSINVTPQTPVSRFLFFTDMHMDVRYKAGASANCGEPLCCRDNNPVPSNPSDAAWKYGDYRNCDMPTWTVEGMMSQLGKQNEELDFIIFTGDIPAHNVWNQTSADQIDKLQRWTNLLTKYFPGTPVYAALGNHESAPVNSYPPHNIYNEKGANISWLYETAYKSWQHWIPKSDLYTVMQGGFYTTLIQPGLRVVSLNTNYCSDDSWWLIVGANSVDPENQLNWFAHVMHTAEMEKERVMIITHRPTGGCIEAWSRNYYNIINRYQSTIIAQFFGHAHTDELRLYYDIENPSKASVVGLVGPGFTTYSNLNAGYRIYTMDGNYNGTSHALLDAESYFLNITDANLKNSPEWKLEYSMVKDYGMKNLSPSEWQKLVDGFDGDDSKLQLYHKFVTKSEDTSYCDDNCKKSTVCGIKQFRPGDNNHC